MAKKAKSSQAAAGGDADDLATKAPDTAVQRALIEARQDIFHFLRRRLGDQDAAEEVLQHFSLRAIERASELRDVRSVRGWLSQILANAIVDHQRQAIRRRRRETALEESHFDRGGTEFDDELDRMVCNCLHRLLPTLKPEYGEIVWRADLLGEPRDRIAASLGVTLNNVTVRLHRGRQALRKRLEEMCSSCPTHGFLDCRCDEQPSHLQRRAQSS